MWSEHKQPPVWWTAELTERICRVADAGYPNEVCGAVYKTGMNIRVHAFASEASPVRVDARPGDVISFAYALDELHGTVLALFHSHPGGERGFSHRDGRFADWSPVHVLCVRNPDGAWDLVHAVYRTEDSERTL